LTYKTRQVNVNAAKTLGKSAERFNSIFVFIHLYDSGTMVYKQTNKQTGRHAYTFT